MRAYRLKSARRAYWRLNGPQSLGAFQWNHIFAERNGVRDVAHLHEFTDRRERPCGALWESKPVIEDSDQYLSRQSRNTVSQCPCPDHAQIPAPTYRQRPTLRTLAATPQRCALELVSAQLQQSPTTRLRSAEWGSERRRCPTIRSSCSRSLSLRAR